MRWCSILLALVFLASTSWAIDISADRQFDRLWASYLPIAQEQFLRHLELDEATLKQLTAHRGTSVRMKLRLDRRGRVDEVELLDPSRVERFTRACLAAAQQMGRLPHLPPEILKRGQTQGVEFVFGTN